MLKNTMNRPSRVADIAFYVGDAEQETRAAAVQGQ
jgi:hypothetical protein